MGALFVGYARCPADRQELTARRDALLGPAVEAGRLIPWLCATLMTDSGSVCSGPFGACSRRARGWPGPWALPTMHSALAWWGRSHSWVRLDDLTGS